MIINKIIDRPIAVSMSLLALLIIGCISLKYIPISLMPNMDVPQIVVQTPCPNYSVKEVDEKILTPLRNQLQQVYGLEDIRCEAISGIGSIHLTFAPNCNINMAFIEVNEKIDRALSRFPKEVERPKVIKASAMDIPAFYLNISLKSAAKGNTNTPESGERFMQLEDFVRNVVVKRIEQLPQTAMVDVSGIGGTEIVCIPDMEKMTNIGMGLTTLEKALSNNNITMETLTITEGVYRYNIHFEDPLISKHDIENIYVRHDGRIFQLKDLCKITEQPTTRNGFVLNDGKDAITLAVVKQDDAQMNDLQENIQKLLKELRNEHTNVCLLYTSDAADD